MGNRALFTVHFSFPQKVIKRIPLTDWAVDRGDRTFEISHRHAGSPLGSRHRGNVFLHQGAADVVAPPF